MAANNMIQGELESVKALSHDVRFFRRKVITFMLSYPTPSCLSKKYRPTCQDLNDVLRYLRDDHNDQCARYHIFGTWRAMSRRQDMFWVSLAPKADSVSIDLHHVDSWSAIVEYMDEASKQEYRALRDRVKNKTGRPSPEYQAFCERVFQKSKEVATTTLLIVREYLTNNRTQEHRVQFFPAFLRLIDAHCDVYVEKPFNEIVKFTIMEMWHTGQYHGDPDLPADILWLAGFVALAGNGRSLEEMELEVDNYLAAAAGGHPLVRGGGQN